MRTATTIFLLAVGLASLSISPRAMADVDRSHIDEPAASSVTVDIDVVVAPVNDVDAFGISYSIAGDAERGFWNNNQVGDITPRHSGGPSDNIMFASGPLVAQMKDGLVSQSRLITHGSLSLVDGRESEFIPLLLTAAEAQIRLRLNGHVKGDSIDLHVTVTGAYDRSPHEMGTCVAIRRGLSREILPGGSLVIGGILTRDGRYIWKRQPVLSTYSWGCHIGCRNVTEPSEELMIFISPHIDSSSS